VQGGCARNEQRRLNDAARMVDRYARYAICVSWSRPPPGALAPLAYRAGYRCRIAEHLRQSHSLTGRGCAALGHVTTAR
jgi:hypothetical protein